MKIYGFILLIITLAFASCQDEWKNHYEQSEESVNIALWDTLQTMEQYSRFVEYMEMYQLDTILKSSNPKTLFIPDNEALDDYLKGDTSGIRETLMYHIIPTFYMIRNVEVGKLYRLKTLAGKFGLIENIGHNYYFDGIEVLNYSPLFEDGKYYEINQVIKPKPSLYQYLKYNLPPFARYIDTQDSTILDREKSEPIGFNEEGETIYDSVTIEYNLYEEEYFAISEEFRNFSATLVLPDTNTYYAALNEMARELGPSYQTHEDIPEDWQNEVLMPILFKKGTYGGMLDRYSLAQDEIPNINGDRITTDFQIDPVSRYICSNGLYYAYQDFSIEEELYKENIVEGESLCESIGANRFTWIPEKATIEGDKSYRPDKFELNSASNDSVLSVTFIKDFQGDYEVNFKIENVFPNEKYRFVWRTNYRSPGLYSVYVNGEKVKFGSAGLEVIDTYDLLDGFFSVMGYRLYKDDNGFCSVDAFVENITEYGDVNIKIEYLGPGKSTNVNGLSFDYMALLPVE